MSLCLNCLHQNKDNDKFCQQCRTKLLLKDRYRALSKLGNGAFGRTFKAKDQDIPSQPLCVIKQFFPEAQGTSNLEKAAQLFSQEAERLDSLGNHPQIPTLLAHFSQEGRQYLIQQFIDGRDLEKELAISGAFKEDQIREFLGSLLPVLEFIHSKNVIHRDIKPANIIQSNNQWFLVDFGAAKLVDTANPSAIGTRIGTLGYTAPEQNHGQAVYASDIYSLGVTCIHLLTNKQPSELLFDAHESKWQWRNCLAEGVSDDLASLLDKMLSYGIKHRFQSAKEVLAQLHLQQEVVEQPEEVVKQPEPQPSQPNNPWMMKLLKKGVKKGVKEIIKLPLKIFPPGQDPTNNGVNQEIEAPNQHPVEEENFGENPTSNTAQTTMQEAENQLLYEQQLLLEKQRLIQQIEAEKQKQEAENQRRIKQLEEEKEKLEAEKKRQEAEKKRLEEAEKKRLEEAEKKRLEEAEKKRLEEAEKKRLEAEIIELENQRLLSGEGNYIRLRDLLAKGRWAEADKETTKQMLKVAKRKNQGWLNSDSLNNFPCKDLKIIDQLWVKYSKGKFGFSVQRKIWLKCGGKVNYNTEEKLGYRLGWIKDGKWIEYQNLTFDPRKAARGHFPSSPRLAGAVKRWQAFLIMLSGFILLGILCAICLTPILPGLLAPLGINWATLGIWLYILLLAVGVCIGFSLWWLWWLPRELCANCVILSRYSRCL